MPQPLDTLKETPSQTAGPYLHIGLMPTFVGIRGPLDDDRFLHTVQAGQPHVRGPTEVQGLQQEAAGERARHVRRVPARGGPETRRATTPRTEARRPVDAGRGVAGGKRTLRKHLHSRWPNGHAARARD